MCSDIFRDYEADYSATLSAEEVELQADEEEEGRGKLLLILGMPSLFNLSSSCSSSPLILEYGAVVLFSVFFFFFFPPVSSLPLSFSHCTSMHSKYRYLLYLSLRESVHLHSAESVVLLPSLVNSS